MSIPATAHRNLTRFEDDPQPSERRCFAGLQAAGLGVHFLKHVLRDSEAWGRLLPETFAKLRREEVVAWLEEAKRRLQQALGPLHDDRWFQLVVASLNHPEAQPVLLQLVGDLKARFPDLLEEYIQHTIGCVKWAGPVPSHCVYTHSGVRKEGYVDGYGIFVSLVRNRHQSAGSPPYIALTSYRGSKGFSDEERRRDQLKDLLRQEDVITYSVEVWTRGTGRSG
jgi:hypothetical protein